MKQLLILTSLLAASCSQIKTDDHYWCSYETDPEAYQNCLEVGRDLDEHTAESAGHREDTNR
ncbi:hypothetical protein [Gilvimarinus xylanilyticus]|uniref:Lipoprotein n=1 Tax=Gilvimarinus xylanilyticus TaxID=2944139 RepID=A0A9X2I4T3_9GAMM|nr:hypothetical protein [Gilvimarinus xylanilyticus]MCP8900006.1 hypothetical protein [Gilvimarinus xylanilyticus]